MSKEEWRAAERAKPIGEDGLARVRKIKAEGQFAKVNECAVDLFAACAIVAVFDGLTREDLKAKLLRMPVPTVARVCLQAVK